MNALTRDFGITREVAELLKIEPDLLRKTLNEHGLDLNTPYNTLVVHSGRDIDNVDLAFAERVREYASPALEMHLRVHGFEPDDKQLPEPEDLYDALNEWSRFTEGIALHDAERGCSYINVKALKLGYYWSRKGYRCMETRPYWVRGHPTGTPPRINVVFSQELVHGYTIDLSRESYVTRLVFKEADRA